ncbi:GDSL-type esterase/lipase family protein [Cellulophaga sp. BC115SP]|uniref:SGNH/GDSL hydrolase family protein n=1 Tax=Cellulophaga sp. BC115SP TaxID=2683263 RepID=UPI001411DEDF|nr:GDSL-type esterase/lipase family protein [Cellulophaga sp. BC115SP]NBB29074.1 hypothetical protein [Cellulophaga sp. BC115SP]
MQKLFPENATILLLGDSILAQENWSKWLGRLDISNQAYGGAITQQIRWNIGKGFPEKTKLVILNGGINDLFSGVPVEHILDNYAFFIQQSKKQSIQLIINSCIYTENQAEINQKVKELNEGLLRLCNREKIPFCDINTKLSENGFLLSAYSIDGVHLQKNAYQVWSEMLLELITSTP